MFEVKDLELITEFLKKIRERNIEYEYEITAPIITKKDVLDLEKKEVIEVDDNYVQKIEINLYKETKKESE